MTFVLGNGLRVRVPNDQFLVPGVYYDRNGSRLFDMKKRELLMHPISDGTTRATLGRYFFTSAYLMVDHDAETFTLWQANPTGRTNLTPVDEKAAQAEDCEAGGGGGSGADLTATAAPDLQPIMSPGVIVGVALGSVAGLAALIVMAFLLFRRRKRKATEASMRLSQSTGAYTVGRYEVEAEHKPIYMMGDNEHREVEGSYPHREDPRPVELGGNEAYYVSPITARPDSQRSSPTVLGMDNYVSAAARADWGG